MLVDVLVDVEKSGGLYWLILVFVLVVVLVCVGCPHVNHQTFIKPNYPHPFRPGHLALSTLRMLQLHLRLSEMTGDPVPLMR